MSGICGIVNFQSTLDVAAIVSAIAEPMRSWGPDGQVQWSGSSAAFAHLSLRIAPQSDGERQPCVSDCGSYVAVWDGRLDNRAELRQLVERNGRRCRNASDAELALQAFLLWRESCPRRFLGDFAFSVWDAKHRRLFCARDHLGVRPLYYVLNSRLFAFASLDEALLRVPGISSAVDEQRVAYFLVPEFRGFDMSGSWHREVRALRPGQSLTLDADGRVELSTYWTPPVADESKFRSDQECAEAFRAVFDAAVACRLPPSGPVGLMLSGGLDSSSILASVEAQGGGADLHTYSAISDQSNECVESRCVLDLADGRPFAHFLYLPSCSGMLSDQEVIDTVRGRVHPVDHSVLLPALMCRAAGRDGLRVMLTGLCGDLATLPGYPHVVALLRRGQWRHALRESRASSRHHTFLQGSRPSAIFATSAYRAFAPAPIRQLVHRLRHRAGDPFAASVIRKDFAASMRVTEWIRASRHRALGSVQDLPSAHADALLPPHGVAACMGCYTRVASRWGIEVRDPWVDRRVVEFWLGLPIRFRWRDGWTKYLVRQAFAKELPGSVLHRSGKEHVGWNVVEQFMARAGPRTEAALEEALAGVDNFLDVATAKRIFSRYLATGSYDDCLRIFDALTLGSWVRQWKSDE